MGSEMCIRDSCYSFCVSFFVGAAFVDVVAAAFALLLCLCLLLLLLLVLLLL